MKYLLTLIVCSALSCFATDGYLTVTNRTTKIGAGGGDSGVAGDGYVARTNRTTVIASVSGGTNDGTFTVTNFTTLSPTNSSGGGGNLGNDTGIAGMAYFWSYADLAANSTVSTWVDRIQAVDAHQGNSSIQPTNSSTGVWFNGSGMRLTNVDFTLPQAKYTIWIVFTPTGASATYNCIFASKDGANGFFRHGPLLVYYQSADRILFVPTAGTNYDMMYSNAGTGSAGGGIGYTNAVATLTIIDKGTAQTFGSMGSDNASEHFQGYIKFIGIWTNATLSAGNASTLYTYSQAH